MRSFGGVIQGGLFGLRRVCAGRIAKISRKAKELFHLIKYQETPQQLHCAQLLSPEQSCLNPCLQLFQADAQVELSATKSDKGC